MTPDDLLSAFHAHNWMALLVFASLLVRTWLTDKSAFPLSLPVNWQPVVTGVAVGFVNAIASVQAGVPAETLVMTTIAWAAGTGLFDGILAACFGSPTKAPAWAKIIVGIIDDLEKPFAGGGGTAVVTAVVVPPAPHAEEATPTLVEKVPVVPSRPPPATPPTAARLADYLPPPALIAGVLSCGVVLTLPIAVFVIGILCAGCPAPASLPTPGDIAVQFAAQQSCVDDADAGNPDVWKADVMTCIKARRVTWCHLWPAAADCPSDAGLSDGASE